MDTFGTRFRLEIFGASHAPCVGITLRVKHILGGITGDILGLLCEVSQLTFLFVCIIFSTRGYV